MGNTEINRVLSEMRALSARSTLPSAARPEALDAGESAEKTGFVQALKQAATEVNNTQMEAGKAATDFQLGRGDLASTMLKMQESGVQFRAAVEIRNRVVSAYQDIMNMPL